MAINISKGIQEFEDSLGPEPEINVVTKVKTERIRHVQRPVVIAERTIGCSWIVGSSTNGIVGANTSTQGGTQQVVGSCGKITTWDQVRCPNNIYFEHFDFDTFRDTSNDIADWQTSSSRLVLNSQGEGTAQSRSVSLESGSISSAVLSVTGENTDSEECTYYLSNDCGSTWEEVVLSQKHNFTSSGNDLRWKIVVTGGESAGWPTPWGSWGSNANTQVVLETLKITFN